MALTVINQDGEQALMAWMQIPATGGAQRGAFYFMASQIQPKPDEKEILLILKPVLADAEATLYVFSDGDCVITFNGPQEVVFEMLRSRLYECFGLTERTLHHYYDTRTDAASLLQLCSDKIARLSSQAKQMTAKAKNDAFRFEIPTERLHVFREAVYARNFRVEPEILIVEDQAFSANLLYSLFVSKYKTYKAENARIAWECYIERAPSIVFLDIELPDVNGHQLSQQIHAIDPQAYIVMVTANNYEKDITQSISQGAKGFIAKPFSRQKIMQSIDKFKGSKSMQKMENGA